LIHTSLQKPYKIRRFWRIFIYSWFSHHIHSDFLHEFASCYDVLSFQNYAQNVLGFSAICLKTKNQKDTFSLMRLNKKHRNGLMHVIAKYGLIWHMASEQTHRCRLIPDRYSKMYASWLPGWCLLCSYYIKYITYYWGQEP
jgi:hypothetical protein